MKHKRRYAPAALTPKERKVLARKSIFSRVWLMTGKKVYVAITRGLFNFTDREGGGKRLVNDAPVLIERIKANPAVRDVAIVAFADRRAGVGLYAFVEGSGDNLEATSAHRRLRARKRRSRPSTSRSRRRCRAMRTAPCAGKSCS